MTENQLRNFRVRDITGAVIKPIPAVEYRHGDRDLIEFLGVDGKAVFAIPESRIACITCLEPAEAAPVDVQAPPAPPAAQRALASAQKALAEWQRRHAYEQVELQNAVADAERVVKRLQGGDTA